MFAIIAKIAIQTNILTLFYIHYNSICQFEQIFLK